MTLTFNYTRTETAVCSTTDHIVMLMRTVHTNAHGNALDIGPWHGSIIRDSEHGSTVVMTATDNERGNVIAACEEFMTALALAQERDPQPST